VAEEKGASCEGKHSKRCRGHRNINLFLRRQQGKYWIFDSGSTVHVCFQKELFNNFLVAKEEGIVKMVDGSACEVIGTETIKVTGRDRTVRTLEAVRYVPEARYNLISIRVLDEKGCRIQMQ